MQKQKNHLRKPEVIRLPTTCRNGPKEQRKCSIDCYCMVVFLLAYATHATVPIYTAQQIQTIEGHSEESHPLTSMQESMDKVLICLGACLFLSLMMVIPPFLFPEYVAGLYIPVFLICTGGLGTIAMLEGLGFNIPYIDDFFKRTSNNNCAIIVGLVLLFSFVLSLLLLAERKDSLRYLKYNLMIARQVIKQNWYLPIFSILMCCLSITIINASTSLLFRTINPDNDSVMLGNAGMTFMIVFWILMTHGILISFSDFVFESVTIQWYFNETKEGNYYNRLLNLWRTGKYVLWHFSTIIYGAVLAFIPDSLSTVLQTCQTMAEEGYSCCCFANNSFTRLTKLSYIETILQSLSFAESNLEIQKLREKAFAQWPQVYMVGSFFITLAKLFTVSLSLALFFVLMLLMSPNELNNTLNALFPFSMLLMTTLQITQHCMNMLGLIGDSMILLYTFDYELQRRNYNETTPYSCPFVIKYIMRRIKQEQFED